MRNATEAIATMQQNLGAALRAHRVRLRLSQEDLAEKVGLHRTYIGSVERGERNISLRNLCLLAHAFEIELSTLIVDAEKLQTKRRAK